VKDDFLYEIEIPIEKPRLDLIKIPNPNETTSRIELGASESERLKVPSSIGIVKEKNTDKWVSFPNFEEIKYPNEILNLKEEKNSSMTSPVNNKGKRTGKTLQQHRKDVEPIVTSKGGKIVKSEWRYLGKDKIKSPYFRIECDKGHRWWALKSNLLPSKSNQVGSWCPDPDCRGKSLEEHQKDIEDIVKAKGGVIVDSEWRYIGNRKDKFPYFLIECECDEKHRWWARKSDLLPSKNKSEGTWCPAHHTKTLEEHQQDVEPIVKAKAGKILKSEWRYIGKKKVKHPFFYIECHLGHEWWVFKGSLLPSKSNQIGSWCPDPDCRGKSLEEHQKDIEDIVKAKGGVIVDSEWRYIGNRKTPFFFIECECEKKHQWWVNKYRLLPSTENPEGTWCPAHHTKTLEEHRKDIEPIVKRKRGIILDSKWRYLGKKTNKHPYFKILCNKGHDWWASKTLLKPVKSNPKGSWCKICQDRIGAIGIFGHILLEYYSLKLIDLRQCNAKHEDSLEEGGKPDLIIERNSNFKANIELCQDILYFSEKIEIVIVDFTLALKPKVVLEHCLRNYQGENRFLIIVLLREEGKATVQYFRNLLDNDPEINKNYRENIKIINFTEYLSFLNLDSYLNLIDLNGQLDILNFSKWNSKPQTEKEIVKMFLKTIRLCIKAIDDDSALDELKHLSEKYSKFL